MSTELQTVVANLSGGVRREKFMGRDYYVAPLSMLVPGVLNGSKGALFYPSDEVQKNPQDWNNMPIVNGHPMVDGRHVSARHPQILEQYQFGFVFNTRYQDKLISEGWFDVERTRQINPGILAKLQANQQIELSTGLFTDDEPSKGVYNGRNYDFVSRNYRPDHLAVLSDAKGACSLEDGCGVLVNEKTEQTFNELVVNYEEADTDEPFSKWYRRMLSSSGSSSEPTANCDGNKKCQACAAKEAALDDELEDEEELEPVDNIGFQTDISEITFQESIPSFE